MTTKMMKKRWEHRASLAEFAPHLYPKGLNYPMTSRSTMDPSSPNTRRLKRNSDAKSTDPPHRRDTIMVKQAGERNNWNLG
jgi:hypothetical protein